MLVALLFCLVGNFEAILARTHHFTSLVSHLITSHTQLILLGAGYDTRCMQLSEWNTHATCYEIDVETTQTAKKERVAELHQRLMHHPMHPLSNITLDAMQHTRYIPFNMSTCWDPSVTVEVAASHDAVDVMCPMLTDVSTAQHRYDASVDVLSYHVVSCSHHVLIFVGTPQRWIR